MSKGFILFLVGLVAAGYYIYQQDSARKGRSSASGGDGLVEIAPGTFESEVMASTQPVVAYFWAPW